MAVFKCKMCEANLEVSGNTTVVKCEYCGTTQTVPWAEDGAARRISTESSEKIENLLKRGNLSLEDKKWDDAEKYFDRVLDINVEESRAYVRKLLAENRVQSLDELWKNKSWNSVKSMDNYKKAYRFAGDDLKKTLDEYHLKWVYRLAKSKSESKHISDVEEAVRLFESIIDYEDSGAQAERCREMIYKAACEIMESADEEHEFIKAKSAFESISGYWDADSRAEECALKAKEAADEATYQYALTYENSDNISDVSLAIRKYDSIPDYKDSRDRSENLKVILFEMKQQAENEKRQEELHEQEMIQQMEREGRQKAKLEKAIKSIVRILIILAVIFYILAMFWLIPYSRYNKALKLYKSGDYDKAILVFEKTNNYSNSSEMIKESCYAKASQLYANEDYKGALLNFRMIKGYKDSENMINEIIERYPSVNEGLPTGTISAGDHASAGVRSNGKVVYNRKELNWSDIVAVSVNKKDIVGLKSDGTVVADIFNDYSGWSFITAISSGNNHTVGLRLFGTVVAEGSNINGQCDLSSWSDIVAVSVSNNHTVGLKSDGTVVAAGRNEEKQCNVEAWTDIIAISAGESYTVGLRSDGTVIATGNNSSGQLDLEKWTDIVAISAGSSHTVGLKSDGTVVAVGDNFYKQCDVSDWTDIVAVSAGVYHTIGLKSDGTVIAVGGNLNNQCDVSGWSDIKTTP